MDTETHPHTFSHNTYIIIYIRILHDRSPKKELGCFCLLANVLCVYVRVYLLVLLLYHYNLLLLILLLLDEIIERKCGAGIGMFKCVSKERKSAEASNT